MSRKPEQSISQNVDEVVLYQSDMSDLVDSHSANVKITNNKAIIDNKTFVLKNISAVSVFSNEDTMNTMDKINTLANKGLKFIAFGLFVSIIPFLSDVYGFTRFLHGISYVGND